MDENIPQIANTLAAMKDLGAPPRLRRVGEGLREMMSRGGSDRRGMKF